MWMGMQMRRQRSRRASDRRGLGRRWRPRSVLQCMCGRAQHVWEEWQVGGVVCMSEGNWPCEIWGWRERAHLRTGVEAAQSAEAHVIDVYGNLFGQAACGAFEGEGACLDGARDVIGHAWFEFKARMRVCSEDVEGEHDVGIRAVRGVDGDVELLADDVDGLVTDSHPACSVSFLGARDGHAAGIADVQAGKAMALEVADDRGVVEVGLDGAGQVSGGSGSW